ncbi:26S proteasome regulatory subunit 7 isoform X1 [Ricinus communis]|uniref:26S protease regulatory subunit, putative n=1 Tax=Ricinus communis TaxID=3988 RepID=B9RXE9_RICCO|nr:26S proteasome regulatory subunit 7 isoform X1 [Ricinus communis]EEF43805.1 26S protease regulatory subunit, putative [Ricinus communis]|eukprot:XP_002518418.1 26S proteasome regulatory subunit 7 isoform X1 [Ricinus communis]
MASLGRLLRRRPSWSRFSCPKTLKPSPNHFLRPLHHLHICSPASEIQLSTIDGPYYSILPAVFAGFLGLGMFQVAYADSDQAAAKPSLPSESPSSYKDLEEIATKERQRIEGLLKLRGIKNGSYPRFMVAVKGQKVTIKFQIPPACDALHLIANLVSNLGLKVDERAGGSDMLLRAWDSAVAWQLTLSSPEKHKEAGVDKGQFVDMNTAEGDLCIFLFRSLISTDKAEIEFIKGGSLSTTELDALVSVLQLAGDRLKSLQRIPGEGAARMPSADKSVATLESMGVRIYGLNEPHINSSKGEISWNNIAGYDQQKQEIEDTILLALHSPEVYDNIARGTRRKFESNRPRAVLFEGPPGTGKTSCARVIATQAGVPLLYVPLEVVMSKYYGESEKLLGKVFALANELPNGAIIFLDEVDSFAVARDNEMHEATRRILSVLLRQIDGFEQDKKVVVIAATNRKQDLDPALISRFDSMITFGLPDEQNRQEIVAQYAKHLKRSDIEELAKVTDQMSGRDIKDVCQQAERSWASKIIRGKADRDGEQGNLPTLSEYIESALIRRQALLSIADQRSGGFNPSRSRSGSRLDLC